MEFNQNQKCCVAGCTSSFPSAPNISYHRFPPKLELTAVQLLNELGNIEAVSRHEAWKRILQLKQPDTSEMTVCSRHFKADEFQSLDKQSLNRNAIPTLNLPPVPAQKSLRIRSDKDLLKPLKRKNPSVVKLKNSLSLKLKEPLGLELKDPLELELKDPLALSTSEDTNPVVVLNHSLALPNYVQFKPDTASKSPIVPVNIKRGVGNSADTSANLSRSQSQSSPVPAKRPRVAAIKNRNQSPAAPQVFFVGMQGNAEPSPVIQSVKKLEKVQPNKPSDVKSPANPIIFLKQVPKPVGVKLMPAKSLKLKAIIADVQRNVIGSTQLVAQPNGQPATQVKNVGEQTASSREDPPKVGNSSATVGKPKAQPSTPQEQLGAIAGTTRKFDKGKRVICLSSDESDPELTGAAGQEAYLPVNEYCAFINCATHMKNAGNKVAFPSEPATRKVWLRRAGIGARLPETVLEQLFVCDKHFNRLEFSPGNVLKPGICPSSYTVYNDSSAIDGNPYWVQKKMRTNCQSTVTDNSGTKAKPKTGEKGKDPTEAVVPSRLQCEDLSDVVNIHSNPFQENIRNVVNIVKKAEVCCLKNCPPNSDNTTVLHRFPAIVNRVLNLRVAYQIQKRYGGKKICDSHLAHPFFKNGNFTASAAVLLDLQLLWVDSNNHNAERSDKSSGTASEVTIDILENSQQEDSMKTKVYIPMIEYCAFINCATHASEADEKIKFPVNESMRHRWSLRAGIPRSFPVDGLKLLFVCEKHFTENQFMRTGGVKYEAVPMSYRLYRDPAVNKNGPHWRRKKSLTTCYNDFSEKQPKVAKCCIEDCQGTPMFVFPPLGALGYLIRRNKLSRANMEYYKKQKVCGKHLYHQFCDDAALSKAISMIKPHSTQEVLDRISKEALSSSSGDAVVEPDVINLCIEGDSAVNASASPQTVYKPMRHYCAVINCATDVKKAARKFLFPAEKDVRNVWRLKAGIPSCVADEDFKMLFICANHFKRAQFSKWGTLLPGSVPEDYKLYHDPLASDSQPHWLRKKRLTNCDSKIEVVEKCAIKECTNSSKTTQMRPFPSLNGFIRYGSLSKNVINYYENKKICTQHLEHEFFENRLLNNEAIKLLDLRALSVSSAANAPKQPNKSEVAWKPFSPWKAAHRDVDFYGDVKGKAILRKECIEFPYIKRELAYSEVVGDVNMFRYFVQPFTRTPQTANERPTPGKRVQVHTALIIDDDCEAATIERIRKAFEQNGKFDF